MQAELQSEVKKLRQKRSGYRSTAMPFGAIHPAQMLERWVPPHNMGAARLA